MFVLPMIVIFFFLNKEVCFLSIHPNLTDKATKTKVIR